MFPDLFHPEDWGLLYEESAKGDFNANHLLDVADIDLLLQSKILNPHAYYWLLDTMFDLNSDGIVDRDDHRVWVKDLGTPGTATPT